MANEFAANFQEALKAKRRSMGANNRARTKNYKPKTWLYPWAHERKYKNFLLNEFSKPLSRFTINNLTDKIPRWKKEVNQDNAIRTDDYVSEFNQFLNDLKQEANNILGDDENIEQTIFFVALLGIAEGIFSFNNSQWKKQTEQVLGFEYATDDSFWEETRRQWANENYGHLQGYSEEHRRRIREAVNRGIRQNISTKEIMDEIKNINNWKDNKVELLARDQTGKLNGIITKRRQEEVGISIYIWQTAQDERVRETHKNINGMWCKWSDNNVYANPSTDIERNEQGNIVKVNWKSRPSSMPQGAIPGSEIQCRCQAIPFWEPVIQQADYEV